MADPRYVTITSTSPPLSVTGLRGEAPPALVSGYGGWNVITRPRRKSLTEWDGIDPLQVDVTLILGLTPTGDALALNRSAGPDVERLERMAMPVAGGEPPIVHVRSLGVPHNDLGWVIQGFDWDAAPIYSNSGFIVRQSVTVHLLEYVADDRLSTAPAAAKTRQAAASKSAAAARTSGGTTTKHKIYVVRSGDTLSSIAAKQLGSYKRWPEIAALNGIRDPKSITVGQRLRLP